MQSESADIGATDATGASWGTCDFGITASRELNDGYAFRVDPTKASLADVAHWLDLWRRCCPFYEFQIDFHAADASVWLSVKGRPGVKEYIRVDSPRLAAKLPK